MKRAAAEDPSGGNKKGKHEPSQWNSSEVSDWMTKSTVPFIVDAAPRFEAANVTGERLQTLKNADLKKLGISIDDQPVFERRVNELFNGNGGNESSAGAQPVLNITSQPRRAPHTTHLFLIH